MYIAIRMFMDTTKLNRKERDFADTAVEWLVLLAIPAPTSHRLTLMLGNPNPPSCTQFRFAAQYIWGVTRGAQLFCVPADHSVQGSPGSVPAEAARLPAGDSNDVGTGGVGGGCRDAVRTVGGGKGGWKGENIGGATDGGGKVAPVVGTVLKRGGGNVLGGGGGAALGKEVGKSMLRGERGVLGASAGDVRAEGGGGELGDDALGVNEAGGGETRVGGGVGLGGADTGVGGDAIRLRGTGAGLRAEVALDARAGRDAPPRVWGVGGGSRGPARGGGYAMRGGGSAGSRAPGGD